MNTDVPRSYERRPRNRWLVPTLVLLGMTVALVVFAGNDDKKEKSGAATTGTTLEHGTTGTTGTVVTSPTSTRPAGQLPASYRGYMGTKLLGATVKNMKDEQLGKIEDLVINMNTGEVRYAILSFGGLLGVGDDWYAVPVRELRPDADDDDLIANLDKNRLENSKKFSKDTWPKEKSFWDEADKVYGIAPATPPAAQPSKSPTAFRAKDLIGKDVRSLDKRAGKIEDLVVDMHGQRVHAVVFGRDGVAQNPWVGLPTNAFLVSADNHDLVLTTDASKLDRLQGYSSEHWPNANDREAMANIEKDWDQLTAKIN